MQCSKTVGSHGATTIEIAIISQKNGSGSLGAVASSRGCNRWSLLSVEFTFFFQVEKSYRWNLHVINPTLKSTT